eukprot:GHVT01092918.1.p1 GENE.GHVT01092918.1~~GHVT01092918.1.p1  ORF type:complete len:187 (-),score=6.19 GHVT01092918.1:1293-1853(-)
MAEVIHYCVPGRVELHNYSPANSISQKRYNWHTLNQKVLRRFGLNLHSEDVEMLVQAVPHIVEGLLLLFMNKVSQMEREGRLNRSADAVRISEAAKRLHSGRSSMDVGSSCEPSELADGGLGYDEVLRTESTLSSYGAAEHHVVEELRETVFILEERVRSLEELVRIKDEKIIALTERLLLQLEGP